MAISKSERTAYQMCKTSGNAKGNITQGKCPMPSIQVIKICWSPYPFNSTSSWGSIVFPSHSHTMRNHSATILRMITIQTRCNPPPLVRNYDWSIYQKTLFSIRVDNIFCKKKNGWRLRDALRFFTVTAIRSLPPHREGFDRSDITKRIITYFYLQNTAYNIGSEIWSREQQTNV